jgi:tetratricopeptide (TPR) repeat protein
VCPRCGFESAVTAAGAAEPACPRCGIVFSKARAHGPAPRPPRPATAEHAGAASAWRLLVPALALVALPLVAARALRQTPAEPTPPPPSASAAAPAGRDDAEPAWPFSEMDVPAAPGPEDLAPPGVPEADRRAAEGLAAALETRRRLGPDDLRRAEGLFLRHPDAEPVAVLFEAVVATVASQARAARRQTEAAEVLRRGLGLLPDSRLLRLRLAEVSSDAGDWHIAEEAARDVLAALPGDAEALRLLGWALLRQDRNREAEEALAAALAVHDDPATRAALERLRQGRASEDGMTERRLAYFNVRYDGVEHDEVGREILRALERHRASLVRAFDHEPSGSIAVILFSRQAYYDATGAPVWAGGHYDSFDGRIRVPIGGLTRALSPHMDGTVVHELTHAFVADLSRGVAPRDVHEGLAQFMEGKRLDSLLSAEERRALARGQIRGVSAFYLSALSFVENLMAQRGQGGMNDLLRAMAETGDPQEAFRRVYGRDHTSLRRDWAQRFQRQHGG